MPPDGRARRASELHGWRSKAVCSPSAVATNDDQPGGGASRRASPGTMRGLRPVPGMIAIAVALLVLQPSAAAAPPDGLDDNADGIIRQAAAGAGPNRPAYSMQLRRTSKRAGGTVGSLRAKALPRGRAGRRRRSSLKARPIRGRGSKTGTRRANTGVAAYVNGTKVGNTSCAAVFTGPVCKEAVWMPQCVSGIFQGGSFRGASISYWTLNRELYRMSPDLRGLLPTRTGWRPLTAQDFESAKAAIPDTDVFDSSSPAGRCALVGSDRGLQHSEMGPYIDGFELVMRMNGAPTTGFEAQVGSRTTHRFVNNAYVGWREDNETLISKWSGRVVANTCGHTAPSTEQLLAYSATGTRVINPAFLSYSQSRDFSTAGHLCTQGFRALLLLLHTCRQVEVFGFAGSGGWYYDKKANRRNSDKALHQHPPPGSPGEQLLPNVSGVDDGSDPEAHRSLRRLQARPGGHKLKVERSCMARLATLGMFRHHVGIRSQ